MGKESKGTIEPGYINRNNQVVIWNTGKRGTSGEKGKEDFVHKMACLGCGYVYGSNGGDCWERICPRNGGESGILLPDNDLSRHSDR